MLNRVSKASFFPCSHIQSVTGFFLLLSLIGAFRPMFLKKLSRLPSLFFLIFKRHYAAIQPPSPLLTSEPTQRNHQSPKMVNRQIYNL